MSPVVQLIIFLAVLYFVPIIVFYGSGGQKAQHKRVHENWAKERDLAQREYEMEQQNAEFAQKYNRTIEREKFSWLGNSQ